MISLKKPIQILTEFKFKVYFIAEFETNLLGINIGTILIISLVILLLFWIVASLLSLFSGYRILFNITTNECLNYEKYSYISFSPFYMNANDKGIKKNVTQFFTCDDEAQKPIEEKNRSVELFNLLYGKHPL